MTSTRKLPLHDVNMNGYQIIATEVIKGIVSVGMIALYVNVIQSATDKCFADMQKGTADAQSAADKRFADLIWSLKDVWTIERERTVAEIKSLEMKVV